MWNSRIPPGAFVAAMIVWRLALLVGLVLLYLAIAGLAGTAVCP